MTYPTADQVEQADQLQLAKWYRMLPSPGTSAVGRDDFELASHREQKIMSRIILRLKDAGGMTPTISKAIGFGEAVLP